MDKTIKLKQEVYADLEKIAVRGETYSQVVERLIRVYKTLSSVADTLGPSHWVNERRVTDARKKETHDTGADSSEVPNVPSR